MPRINVGVIGCGMVAQVMHLPYLHELDDRFEIAALCDVSPALVAALQRDYDVPKTFTDYRVMLDQADVDAVLVLTNHHAPPAIAAARAGKHLLVEKPMVVNLEEADELIDAVRASDVRAMVGYMKRYDPGYLAGLQAIEPIKASANLIELHDVIGPNDLFLRHHKIHRFDDIPEEIKVSSAAALDAAFRVAIGDASPDVKRAYGLMLGLTTHDLAILRGAFGLPEEVLSVEIWKGGMYFTATMRYPGELRCVFYTGITGLRRFDERLTCYAPERIVEIAFPSPFLKSAPTMVTVAENRDGAFHDDVITASYHEAFKEELVHFHDSIVNGSTPRTDVGIGREDTALLLQLVQTYRSHRGGTR